ncbi:hypothetical protein [Streptomyces sp. NPDC056387]|uniref:hypothetical protein n=1 Tax=Streptomyces sp. NPDC056387 TaxID=3345803 RepID=UPI0035E0680C
MTAHAHLRLLLSGALALLLLACTVAAWAAPHGFASASPFTAAPVSSEPCDLVIGPAHDYCTRGPDTVATVTVTSSAATVVVAAGMDGPIGLMLFAAAAIGGAVGLVLAFERRAR